VSGCTEKRTHRAKKTRQAKREAHSLPTTCNQLDFFTKSYVYFVLLLHRILSISTVSTSICYIAMPLDSFMSKLLSLSGSSSTLENVKLCLDHHSGHPSDLNIRSMDTIRMYQSQRINRKSSKHDPRWGGSSETRNLDTSPTMGSAWRKSHDGVYKLKDKHVSLPQTHQKCHNDGLAQHDEAKTGQVQLQSGFHHV
jgi:hypothetical protein